MVWSYHNNNNNNNNNNNTDNFYCAIPSYNHYKGMACLHNMDLVNRVDVSLVESDMVTVTAVFLRCGNGDFL